MEFIEKYWIYALGFFAQSLFGCRLIVQWYYSEKEGKVVSPTIFWQLSLVASFLFLIYGIIREDIVIILGQTLSFYIYVRNLQLKNDWAKIPATLRGLLLLLPPFAFLWLLLGDHHNFQSIFTNTDLTSPLIILGAIGQLMLNLRFIYQWYYSEKHKTSILPLGFWIISTIASVLILSYATYRVDPVLLVAQGMGIFVYVRNMLIHRKTLHKDSVSLRK
ncbi:MAG TPA: lipid-A-disaccharide synthase N-terminal domain-containing protein [Chryseolinea sp.]|nr:lipid-A-disaccharide synthase N-terminal domain-containing protein [Chryseolinea sp.]HPH45798.1 lipid-A-disaccharide synthase N-terminal domain-containing protein [Chryseolinea sp.]HPM28868.1 lipid-A-disaccharide synthase N-terminal domain-containing protein [Chryseolinea sp.]